MPINTQTPDLARLTQVYDLSGVQT